jgi:3-isopropylmalate/(R)-2-methylmalate dehydratase small subunit
MSGAARRVRCIVGRARPLRGNDVDTDRIMPARYLRHVSFAGLERHAFEDDIAQEQRAGRRHPFADPAYVGARVLLVNRNFGCGSSREHAPQALLRGGLEAIVGESFSEIFFGNSVAIGLACLTAAPDDVEALMQRVERDPALEVTIDVAALRLEGAGLAVPLAMPRGAHEALVTGSWDATGMLLERFEEVEAVAARLPYPDRFAR